MRCCSSNSRQFTAIHCRGRFFCEILQYDASVVGTTKECPIDSFRSHAYEQMFLPTRSTSPENRPENDRKAAANLDR